MKSFAKKYRKYFPDADTLNVLIHLPNLYTFLRAHVHHVNGWDFVWIWASS